MSFIQNLYANPVVHSIGWTLLHACWQIIVVGLLLKIALQLTRKAAANMSYTLAVFSLVTICVWSGYTFVNQYHYFDFEIKIASLESDGSNQNKLLVASEIGKAESKIVEVKEVSDWKSKVESLEYYLPVLVVFWLIGAMSLVFRFITSWLQVRRLRSKGLSEIEPSWVKRLGKLKKQIGVQKNVQFFKSKLIHEPVTIGHLKPIILVPIGIFSNLSPEMVETILLHELAHIKRSDFLVNIIQSLVEIIFFFHPGIWWISKKIRQTREHACDDLAVKACNNPMLYAKTLTQIQFSYLTTKNNLAMSATGKNGDFTTRIKRLFDYKESSTRQRKSLIFSSLLFTCLLAFAFTNPFEQKIEINDFSQELVSSDAMMFVITPSTKQDQLDKIVDAFASENIKLKFSDISFSIFGLLESLTGEFTMPDESSFEFGVKKIVYATLALDWNKKDHPLDVRFGGQWISINGPSEEKEGLANMKMPYTTSLDKASLIGDLGFLTNTESRKDELFISFEKNNLPLLFLNGKEISKGDLLSKKLTTQDVTAITKLNPQETQVKFQKNNPNGSYEIYANLDAFGNKRELFKREDDSQKGLHNFTVLYKSEIRYLNSSPEQMVPPNKKISISTDDCNSEKKAFHVFNDKIVPTEVGNCYPLGVWALTKVDSFFILDEKLAKKIYGDEVEGSAYIYYYLFNPEDPIHVEDVEEKEIVSDFPLFSIDTIQLNKIILTNISGMNYAPICYLNDEKLERPIAGAWPEKIKAVEKFDSLQLISGEIARVAYGNKDGKESIWKFYKNKSSERLTTLPLEVKSSEVPAAEKLENNPAVRQGSFKITPNPVSGIGRIEFLLSIGGQVKIVVFDSNGRQVDTIADEKFDKGNHQFDWIPGDLPGGIYHVQVQSEDEMFTESVILHKK